MSDSGAGPVERTFEYLAATDWDSFGALHSSPNTDDRRSAFARITAHVPYRDRELQIEQTLAYERDDKGLIARIEVFWRDPRGSDGRS